MTKFILALASLFLFAAPSSFAASAAGAPSRPNTRTHSFDSQIVEGEVYRPDYSVVTGEAPGEGWGVLRLRADFEDHNRTDRAEQHPQEKKR